MALVSVKLTAAEKKARKEEYSEPFEGDDYPYGMCIDLSDEMMTKLGIKATDFDDNAKVEIHAMATIRSLDISKRNGKKRQSMSLQIEQIEVESEKPGIDVGDALYGSKDAD